MPVAQAQAASLPLAPELAAVPPARWARLPPELAEPRPTERPALLDQPEAAWPPVAALPSPAAQEL